MTMEELHPKISLVSGLNAVWNEVADYGKPMRFAKNQTIQLYGQNCLYLIQSGKVKLSFLEPSGRERTLLFVGPGSILNFVPLFLKHSDLAVVTCLEAVEITVFDGSLLKDHEFIRRHPAQIISLLHSITAHMEIHAQQLGDSTLIPSQNHVCRILWDMHQKNNHATELDPGLSQRELADLLGIHKTTLTRVFIRLKTLGVIGRYTKHHLSILDAARLRSLAESAP